MISSRSTEISCERCVDGTLVLGIKLKLFNYRSETLSAYASNNRH